MATVELVVSGNIEDGSIDKGALRPTDAVDAGVDVAGEHHDIGYGSDSPRIRTLLGAKLAMEVRKKMDLHLRPPPGSGSPQTVAM